MKCNRYLSLLCVSGLLAASVFAQAPAPAAPRHKGRPAAPQASARLASESETPADPAYLMGTVEVTAQGPQNPVIRLGLARHGATVVEFPAADFFFAVHPGSAHIVTVEESPTLATDHYLVFRAGPDFAAPPETPRRAEPQAAVSVQMQSGLFVTLLFYPAPSLAQMAHRCVVRYSRAEVVAARRAAGLAVNLNGNLPESAPAPVVKSSVVKPVAALAGGPAADPVPDAAATSALAVEMPVAPVPRSKNRPAPLLAQAETALRTALAAPAKFAAWSPRVQGLSLAVLPPASAGDNYWLTVVAVHNTTAQGLRLIAPPALETVTLDERGQTALTQPLTTLHTATTSPGGAVPAGATIYYALVYEAPVLGVRQRLRVTTAHVTAADAPATAPVPR
jgi:hypothetical protein